MEIYNKENSFADVLNKLLKDKKAIISVIGFEKLFNGSFYWANIQNDTKKSDISIDESGTIILPFWYKGHKLGLFISKDINKIIDIIILWFDNNLRLKDIKEKYPEIKIDDNESYVYGNIKHIREKIWLELLNYLEFEKNNPLKDTYKLAKLAYKKKELKNLIPFTSHNILCFSRCTGFPFTDDIPKLYPINSEIVKLMDKNDIILFEGSYIDSINKLINILPENYNNIIIGNANNF